MCGEDMNLEGNFRLQLVISQSSYYEMTGRGFACMFCKILRVVAINGQETHLKYTKNIIYHLCMHLLGDKCEPQSNIND